MSMGMPKLNLNNCGLSDDELKLAQGILNSRTGELRVGKPPVAKKVEGKVIDKYGFHSWDYISEADANSGRTAYIWRMVCFSISPCPQHHCMPVTADFDLPGDFDERREEAKRLDAIVDKIVKSVPPSQWYGVNRWAKALGYG